MIGVLRGRGQRAAEALEAAAAKIRQLQSDHAQQLSLLIDEETSAAAMNRKLRAAAVPRAVQLEELIVDEAHRHARRLVAMKSVGQYVSRHRGEHGLSQEQWSWAYAVLRNAGIRADSGAWLVTDLDEAKVRIDQSRRQCRAHGLKALRKYNRRDQYERRRRRVRGAPPPRR